MISKKITRVLLADDHALVQDGIRQRLDRIKDMSVIGMANNGKEMIEMARRLQPDIILADISMPIIGGIQATQILNKSNPDIPILMLSMHDNKQYVRSAMSCGAKGYILKDIPAEEMIESIRTIVRGGTYFSAGISEVLLQADRQVEALTPRETEVLNLLAQGKSNKQTAQLLSLSVRTIETHRSNLYQKTQTTSLAGLVKYAMEHGFN